MAELARRDAARLRDIAPPDPAADRPDVSFIVATYNAAAFVRQAIQSALDQRGVAIEVIVVDDASTDGTPDIVQSMARSDPRIVLIRRISNGGPSAARNQAMARARGHWLAILDGDDLILPERSRRLLDLASLTSADIVADNFERFFTEDGSSGGLMIPPGSEPYSFTVDTASFYRANRALDRGRFTLGAIKGMFRADFLRAHGIAHREGLDFGEDFLFCLKCLRAGGRFIVSSRSDYKYRKHRGSQSWRMKPSHLEQLRVAIAEERLIETAQPDAETAAAARACVHSFENALEFVKLVELAKHRRIGAVLAQAAARRAVWPLLLRFGSAAVLNRIKARLPRRAQDRPHR